MKCVVCRADVSNKSGTDVVAAIGPEGSVWCCSEHLKDAPYGENYQRATQTMSVYKAVQILMHRKMEGEEITEDQEAMIIDFIKQKMREQRDDISRQMDEFRRMGYETKELQVICQPQTDWECQVIPVGKEEEDRNE